MLAQEFLQNFRKPVEYNGFRNPETDFTC